jgi:phenylpyruvate tautomerase PptA (4-oxalocrotonate tautomerase family)
MPLIQVTAPQNALEENDQNALMSRVSNAVLKAERAPIDDAGAQSLVWAYYHEMNAGAIYVGGEAPQAPPFRVAITTPEGALTDEARQTLAKDIGEIIDDIVGPFEDRLNHWVMLTELDEGSWAGGGQIFPLAGIQAAMNIKPA